MKYRMAVAKADVLGEQLRQLALLGFVTERRVEVCYSDGCERYAVAKHRRGIFVTLHEPRGGRQTVIFTFTAAAGGNYDGALERAKHIVGEALGTKAVDVDFFSGGRMLAIRAVVEVPDGDARALLRLASRAVELRDEVKAILMAAILRAAPWGRQNADLSLGSRRQQPT